MSQDAVVRIRLDTSTMPGAAAQAAQAVGTIGKAGETSARQTAAAMRTLPAQFTDIATQLAGGQNPLLILLQQGGQIKDSFGGVRAAVAAVASVVTPAAIAVGGLAAAAGGFALAAYSGNKEAAALRNTIALTGNAAGLTGARLQALSESIAAGSRLSVSGSREILTALASTGQVTSSVLASAAAAVARIAELSGQDATKVAADFATMGSGVAKWAAEHNKAWNFLTFEQYKYIQRLEEQGRSEEAAIAVNKLLVTQMQGLGVELDASGNRVRTLTQAWNDFLETAKAPFRDSLADQLKSAQSRLATARNVQGTPLLEWLLGTPEEAEQRIQKIENIIALTEESAKARSAKAAEERAKIAAETAREAAAKEAEARAAANRKYLEGLLSDNQRAALDLIADEQVKGLALINLDREVALARLNQQKLSAAERQRALAAIEAAAAIARAKLQTRSSADSAKDPLGEFIDEKVLPADRERAAKRLAVEQDYLQDLADANERAAAQLLTDEEERARALIELDRRKALRRLEAMGLGADARATAEGLINRRASAAIDEFGQTLKDTTYDDVRGALGAALRDSRNPAIAFADALGNIIYQRLTASIADSLATAAVGKDGKGGMWGDLVNFVGDIVGGGLSIDTSGAGTPSVPDARPRGGMATGTNYVPRDMLLWAHRGEAIVPRQYNPAAGGMGGGAPSQTVIYQIPPGQSPAAYAAALQENNRLQKAEFAADISRRGRALNNAVALGSR